jgi:1-acyl-sn-glycerol-3-phosphate acyltransferase
MTARDLVQMTFFAFAIRPFLTLFIGLRVLGREHLPKSAPAIMIANHSSHLDTVSLLGLFPLRQLSQLRPVAAADYFERNALVSVFSKTLFNILPISRKSITVDTNPLPRMEAALRAGQSLILFPEGTRGSGEDLARFHSGAAHLIEKCPDVPVVPIFLVNMGRSLPKGEWIPVPFFCEARIGPPQKFQGNCREITAALETAVRQLRDL